MSTIKVFVQDHVKRFQPRVGTLEITTKGEPQRWDGKTIERIQEISPTKSTRHLRDVCCLVLSSFPLAELDEVTIRIFEDKQYPHQVVTKLRISLRGGKYDGVAFKIRVPFSWLL